jgi:PleD family two-component response regulator
MSRLKWVRTVSDRGWTRDASLENAMVNVLLVDDHPENLLALESVLENQGVRLVKATCGTEVLAHLLREDFALILMDVQMPGLDGSRCPGVRRVTPRRS